LFLLTSHVHLRALHSFPTRRSSDLLDDPADHCNMAERQARTPRQGQDGTYPGHMAALVAALGLIPPGPGIAIDLDAGSGACKGRSEEHTSELQSRRDLVCRLLLEKK